MTVFSPSRPWAGDRRSMASSTNPSGKRPDPAAHYALRGDPAGAGATTWAARPKLLAVDEVATWLGLSDKTVRRLVARGELPVHRLGRQLRIAEDDLAAYLNRHRR